jgi:hypothetical protein
MRLRDFSLQTYALKYILIYLDKDQLKTLYFERMNLQRRECVNHLHLQVKAFKLTLP